MSQLLEVKKRQKNTGNYYPRIDGNERTTGLAKYGADWKMEGMLYARIVVCRIPHGIVKRIDTAKAANMSGVKAIITCIDDDTVWSAGDRAHKRRLFADRVRFDGDCIAAVAATTATVAQEAADSIEAEYDSLPGVFSVKESLKPGAPKLWDDGNILGPYVYSFGDYISSFSEKGEIQIFEGDYETPRVYNAQIEPAVSLAWWNGKLLTVVASTQWLHGCRESLANDLGIGSDQVRVITKYKGGGFGGRVACTNYDLIAALLARKTGKPVMVEFSRQEDFIGTHTRWATSIHLRAALNKSDARLLAMELKAYCDAGAYARVLLDYFVRGQETNYSCQAWRSEVYGVYTNTPPSGAMRAPAGPHSCFAAESLVDEIANSLKINPLVFRLNNVAVKAHNESEFTSNGLKQCLLIGAERFGWKEKWHPPPTNDSLKLEKTLNGVGVAMTSWHAGIGRSQARVRVMRDGSIELALGVVDIGTGAKSTLAVIAAEILNVALSKVQVVWGDTANEVYSVGESGSATTSYTGTAVRDAASKIKDRIIQFASADLRSDQLELQDGRITTPNGQSTSISELLASRGLDLIEEFSTTTPTLPEHTKRFSFAAHFAEVDIDPWTGQVTVTKYVAAHDSGQIVNRLTAESQVQGGVIMGIGQALLEKVIIDENYGTIQNPSFLTYRLPNIQTAPKIEVVFADVSDPYGPKGLAEVPVVPVPAVIGNAIFNATGKRLRKLPFMPEDVLRAIDPTLKA